MSPRLEVFDVHGSVPPLSKENPERYRRNLSLTVIAADAQEAMAMALGAIPDLKIDNLKHVGERIVLIASKP